MFFSYEDKTTLLQDKRQHSDGDIAMLNDSGEIYIYNKDWQIFEPEATSNLNLSLYEINQQVISQLPSPTEEKKKEIFDTIRDYIYKTCPMNKYFMLLNNELRYYTIFERTKTTDEDFILCLKDCLASVGDIKTIEEENGAIGIWVTTTAYCHCLYLFPYDEGVVPFGG